MCGFIGIINPKLKNDVVLNKLLDSQKILINRGNDSSTIFRIKKYNSYLAFNRLSIVDLDKRSNQPMKYSHNNKTIIGMLNGEIYNYQDLKHELEAKKYKFNTSSDTEVLLALILDQGFSSLRKLEGIFSIFIFDEEKGKMYLIRDQIGVKPLYYTSYDSELNFIFASETKALINLKESKPNKDKLIEFACFGEISDEKTIFEGINQLLPGEIIEIDLNNNYKFKKTNYFNLSSLYNHISNKTTCANELFHNLKESVTEAINLQTISEVPIGIQLSGGLDSSLLAAIACADNNLNSYSTIFKNFHLSEEYWQDLVAENLSIKNKKIKASDELFNEESISKLIYKNDGPIPHPNYVPCFLMCERAQKDGIKVLLSGDGADEFFSGYKWFKPKIINNSGLHIINNSAFNSPEDIKKLFGIKEIDFSFRESYLKDAIDKEAPNYQTKLSHLYMQRFYLQKWLHRQDRTGMSHLIEIRVPYCDLKLIGNYINLRYNTLHEITGKKSDLKKIAEEYLPNNVIYRDKVGFPVHLEDLFSKNGPLKYVTKGIAEGTFFRYLDFLDQDFASQLAINHLNGKDKNGRLLWTMYNFELWLKNIDN